MNELDTLDFMLGGPENYWREKYFVSWCDLCNTAVISCPECSASSCSGGGCEKCRQDFKDFGEKNTRIEDYLSDEESDIYHKCLRLQRLIMRSIKMGDNRIDFKKLDELGWLSENDREVFGLDK